MKARFFLIYDVETSRPVIKKLDQNQEDKRLQTSPCVYLSSFQENCKLDHLEVSGTFYLAEIFENISFDPYNFWITRL